MTRLTAKRHPRAIRAFRVIIPHPRHPRIPRRPLIRFYSPLPSHVSLREAGSLGMQGNLCQSCR